MHELAFVRLVEAIERAPLVPEWAVERISNMDASTAYTAFRWDTEEHDHREHSILTPTMLKYLQRLANGERVGEIAFDDRRNLYRSLRGAGNRLGGVTPYQTLAIAVNLGFVEVKQEWVLGPKFQISGHIARRDRPSQLMPKAEREILKDICNGLTNGEIAKQRAISRETVNDQVKKMLKKHGAKNRTHLAALAVRKKFVY